MNMYCFLVSFSFRKILERSKDTTIGFGANVKIKDDKKIKELIKDVETDDLIKFGLIPELVGRLPVVCTINELTEEDLIRILKEPKNAITKQYKKLFELEGVDLEFEDDALKEIAKKAIERKTGARGLRAIMEENLLQIMYDLPDKQDVEEIIIDEKVITDGKAPKYVKKSTKKAS